MLGFLAEILQQFWKPIAGAVGIFFAVLGAYVKGRSEQAAKGKTVVLEETVDAHETRAKVDITVAAATPVERQRMRDKWTARND